MTSSDGHVNIMSYLMTTAWNVQVVKTMKPHLLCQTSKPKNKPLSLSVKQIDRWLYNEV